VFVQTGLTYALAAVLTAASAEVRPAGRSEVLLRESDVLFSRAEPLERVFGLLLGEGLADVRIDAATLEFTIDADGEADSFVPFLLVAQAVEPDGQGGYRVLSGYVARELILLPGEGQPVRMLATSLVRRWVGAEGPAYLRIVVEEPVEPVRPPGAIRVVSRGGVLGRIVALVR
jgi:hypothetical protein